MCRASYINRKHLKKKDRFDKRRCTNKLHQQHINEKMTILKCQQIIDKDESFLKKNNNFHKYL